ncbi:hypothetical protein ES705_25935 [subsurface metagenome]|nr:hypothetical protein [Clostridia bacterium]
MKVLKFVCCVVVLALLWGCAPPLIVIPTEEELDAVKRFKKTVAIIEISEKGSPIKGISESAFSGLENALVGHFNLVEREKILKVMAERKFAERDDVERYTELGKLLGADYLFFGRAMAFFNKSEIKHSIKYYKSKEKEDYKSKEQEKGEDYKSKEQEHYKSKKKEEKFSGSIWRELKGTCELNIKIVDVGSGIVRYADKKVGAMSRKEGKKHYNDEKQFYKALDYATKTDIIIELASTFRGLRKENSRILSQAMEQATEKFKDLRDKFPQTGQILQILSEKEVVINLGSAYGIKPGDKLIIWEELAPIKDPKTGVVTVPKQKKAILKVKKVTSGLSCIARGKRKYIRMIRVGDKVSTH